MLLLWGASSSTGFRPGEFGRSHAAAATSRRRGQGYGCDASGSDHEHDGIGYQPNREPHAGQRRQDRRDGLGAASHSNSPPPAPHPEPVPDRGGPSKNRRRREYEARRDCETGVGGVYRGQQRRRPLGGEPTDSIGDIVALYKQRLKSKGPTYYQPSKPRVATPSRSAQNASSTSLAATAAAQPSALRDTAAREAAPARVPGTTTNSAAAEDRRRLSLQRQRIRHRSRSAPPNAAAATVAAATSAPAVALRPAPLPLSLPPIAPTVLVSETDVADSNCICPLPLLPPAPSLSRSSSAAWRRQSSSASADTTRPSSGEYSYSPTHGNGGGGAAAAGMRVGSNSCSCSESNIMERNAEMIDVPRNEEPMSRAPRAHKQHTSRRPPWSIRGPGHDDVGTKKGGRLFRPMPLRAPTAAATARRGERAGGATTGAALLTFRRGVVSKEGRQGRRAAAEASSANPMKSHPDSSRRSSAESRPLQRHRALVVPGVAPHDVDGDECSPFAYEDGAGAGKGRPVHAVEDENSPMAAEVAKAGAVVAATCERWAEGYEALFDDETEINAHGHQGASGRAVWVVATALETREAAAEPVAREPGDKKRSNSPPPHAAAVLRAATSALQEEDEEAAEGGGEECRRISRKHRRQQLKALVYSTESEPRMRGEARLAELRRLAVLGLPTDSDDESGLKGSHHDHAVEGEGTHGSMSNIKRNLGSNGRTSCSLRGLAWKVLLDVAFVDASLYGGLVLHAAAEARPALADKNTGAHGAAEGLNGRARNGIGGDNDDDNDDESNDGEGGDEALAGIEGGMLGNAPRESFDTANSRGNRSGDALNDGPRPPTPAKSAARSMAAALASRNAPREVSHRVDVRTGSQVDNDGRRRSRSGKQLTLVNIVGDARRTFVGEPLFWQLFGGGTGGHGFTQPDTELNHIRRRSAGVGGSSGVKGSVSAAGSTAAGVAPTPWPLVRVLAAMNELASLQKLQPSPAPPLHRVSSDSSPLPSPALAPVPSSSTSAATTATKAAASTSAASPPVVVPGYMPGLNALSGVLLVELPECDAFFTLHRLLAYEMPAYYATQVAYAGTDTGRAALLRTAATDARTTTPAPSSAPSFPDSMNPLFSFGRSGTTLAGAHRGCALVDACLAVLDPPLHAHLNAAASSPTSLHSNSSSSSWSACGARSGGSGAYALPLLLSLFGAARPLRQVLQLWDALLALGPAFVVPLVVAQVNSPNHGTLFIARSLSIALLTTVFLYANSVRICGSFVYIMCALLPT